MITENTNVRDSVEGKASFREKATKIPKFIFREYGVLPFFLGISFLVFAIASDKFFSFQNLVNVARQSVYLILASIGQMMVLVTGGFDLSVGTTAAITSVLSAITMVFVAGIFPGSPILIITAGIFMAILSGLIIGLINGVGVSKFGVSPFIMTLGMQSVLMGLALFLTGGIPVSGLTPEFTKVFGFGKFLEIPIPVFITALVFCVLWVLMNRTRWGTYIYAVGGNIKAANLSGINTRKILIFSYVLCAMLSAMTGFLLTARVESGEANLGSNLALESIAACVVAGISLKGGVGRIQNVVLGAYFIIMIQNGMNILQVGSYIQMVLLGLLLILAVMFDKYRF